MAGKKHSSKRTKNAAAGAATSAAASASANAAAAAPSSAPVWRLSALEATRLRDPHYNGYACGHGVHGDVKFNRAREKQAWMRSQAGE